MIEIKSKREIELMREAGKVLAEVHEKVGEAVAPERAPTNWISTQRSSSEKQNVLPAFFISMTFRQLVAYP